MKSLIHILPLAAVLSCSQGQPKTEDTQGSSVASDAGVDSLADDNQLHVTLTDEYRNGSPIADAMILVEQNGAITGRGISSTDGRWSLDVDWNAGPITVTAWRYGFSVASIVGMTRELVPKAGVTLRLHEPNPPPPAARMEGQIRPGSANPAYSFVNLHSNSKLATETFDQRTQNWTFNAEPGVPVEISYQVKIVAAQPPYSEPSESGYQSFSSRVLDWWRVSLTSPVDGLTFNEVEPPSEMRQIKPRWFQIALPRSPVTETSHLSALVWMTTAQGPLVIGQSFEGRYSANEFVLIMSTTDEIAGAAEVYTKLTRFTGEYKDSSSTIRIDGAGKDLTLSSVEWLSVPALKRADANGIEWSGAATSAYTEIFVAPGDYSAGHWSIVAPAGVSGLTWPTQAPVLTPEKRASVRTATCFPQERCRSAAVI